MAAAARGPGRGRGRDAEDGRAERGARGQGGQRRRWQDQSTERAGEAAGRRQPNADARTGEGGVRASKSQRRATWQAGTSWNGAPSGDRIVNAESLRTRWGSQRDSGAARPRPGETQWAGNITMYGCNGMDDWRGPCVARLSAPSGRAWNRAWQQDVCSGTPSAAQNACNQTSKALRLQKEGFCPERHVFLKARVSARLELTQGPINWKQGPRRDRVAGPLRGGSTSS